jgi:hypothetical protein
MVTMKSKRPLIRVRSFLLSWLGVGLGLWFLPGAQGQTCTLTSPTNTTFAVPGPIVVTADVSVPEGDSVVNVSILANGVPVANLIAPPYSVALNLVNPGNLTLQAVLYPEISPVTPSDLVTVTVGGATNTFAGNSNLVLWLEAGAGVSTNASGAVTNWASQSAYYTNNAFFTVLTNGATPPTWVPDGTNGQPGIAFDSVQTNYFAVPDSPSLAITGDIAGLAVINVPAADWADEPMIWFEGGDGGNFTNGNNGYPSPNGLWISTSGQPGFVRGDGLGQQDIFTGNNPLPASGYAIVGFSVTNGAMTQWLNGAPNGTYTATVTPVDNDGTNLYIGARANFDGTLLSGNIAELMIFNSSLSETNLTDITAYLGGKYGIGLAVAAPDSGPVVSILTPTNGAAMVGLTNFFVTADATNTFAGTATSIATVELFVNGVSAGVTNWPYQWTVYADSPAPITLTVVATDNEGVTNSATSTVSVIGPPGETCTLTSPTNGSTAAVPGTIVAAAGFTLAPGDTVASVSFYANGALVANPIAPPYSVALSLLNPGTLTVEAALTDNLGFTTPSAPVAVTVGGAPASNTFAGNSNLALWLEAAAPEVNTGPNGTVTGWTDLSGQNNNAFFTALTNGATPPTWVNDAIYGQPAIAFDAAYTNYLEVSDSPSLAITGDIAGFAVINVPAANWSDEPMIWFEGGDGRNQPGYNNGFPSPNGLWISSSGQPVIGRGDGLLNQDVFTGNNPLPASGYAIVAFSMTNGTMTQWLNGAPNGVWTAQYSSLYADGDRQGLFIGARGCFDGTFLTGSIAELMLFNTSLSETNLTNITAYLETKYGFIAVAAPEPGPGVSIVTPTNGAAVGAGFVVTATATPAASRSIASVELFANGISVGTLTNSPWQWTVSASLTAPPITLVAVATDNQGAATSATSTVFVPGDLVRNGGFETGTLANWIGFDIGSDWCGGEAFVSPGYITFLNGFLGQYRTVLFPVHSGNDDLQIGSYFICGGAGPGFIAQTLATTPGVTYQISCWYNSFDAGDGGSDGFSLSWNGDGLFQWGNINNSNPYNDSGGNTDGWTNIVCQATATSNSTVLEFGFYAANIAYFSLDDIVVVPAPILSIALRSNAVVITWPQSFSGTLQSATNLPGPWTTVPGVVTNQITITPSQAQQFYRLVWP